MLRLTMTARERAWCQLKITGPLIGWFDGDSLIHGISPRLAPLSWCTLYIVEVLRTSEEVFLRLRNSNSQMASTILVDREGLECEKQLALQGQLETAMKTTIRYAFDAFGANLQCCAIFFFCLQGHVHFFNPLWGHCQEYKIEKRAILPNRLLSEKRSAFAYYNLTLSESFCLTDHEKQVQKFVAHWKVCQKSSQREVIRKNAYKAPKPQRVLLPALLLKFSRSLTNFQASPARQSSLRSKDRCPNHTVV